jgi:hypothetical protein
MRWKIIEDIRMRSRQEWQDLFLSWGERPRNYARDNGEKAALLALILGVLLVCFYKLFVLLFVVFGMVMLSVLLISESAPKDPPK